MYGLGRALQFLAMVDCAIALFIGISNPSAYAIQLIILGSAVILFSLGRLIQKKARTPSIGQSEHSSMPESE